MKENKGKQILKILQKNYEIESSSDLSSAIKDLFTDSHVCQVQQMCGHLIFQFINFFYI